MSIIFRLLKKFPWATYIFISLIDCIDAFVSVIFVYPNDFAPAGVHGFTTMMQHLLGVSAGYTFLIVNIPMIFIAFFVLDRRYSIKNFLYVIFFSTLCLVFQHLILSLDLSHWEFRATSPESAMVLAIGIGVFNGLAYTSTVLMGGSTGGTDILAALINHKKPSFNTVWVLFTINTAVAVMSYFVYGRETLPVAVSILCAFVGGFVSDTLLKGVSSALKFEIITPEPDAIADSIMTDLRHGCTRFDAYGMYSGRQCSVLICVINPRQRTDLEQIISHHKDTFAYCTPITHTYGQFDRIK